MWERRHFEANVRRLQAQVVHIPYNVPKRAAALGLPASTRSRCVQTRLASILRASLSNLVRRMRLSFVAVAIRERLLWTPISHKSGELRSVCHDVRTVFHGSELRSVEKSTSHKSVRGYVHMLTYSGRARGVRHFYDLSSRHYHGSTGRARQLRSCWSSFAQGLTSG